MSSLKEQIAHFAKNSHTLKDQMVVINTGLDFKALPYKQAIKVLRHKYRQTLGEGYSQLKKTKNML